MSDISGRLYNIAKSYVEVARGRIQSIDEAALAELQNALSRTDIMEYQPVSDDPMVRAASKIAAAKARASIGSADLDPSPPATAPAIEEPSAVDQIAELEKAAAPAPSTLGNPVSTAYRVIGVEDGADRAIVEDAVRKLRERCAPDRFAEGSAEREEALKILARIDEAYTLLMRSMNVEFSRFDKLEL